jgi:hypothetical protein
MRCKTLAMVLLLSCKSKGDAPSMQATPTTTQDDIAPAMQLREGAEGEASGMPATPPKTDRAKGKKEVAMERARTMGVLGGAKDESSGFDSLDADGTGDMTAAAQSAPGAATIAGKPRRPEGPTRAWFPETFLFEPLVVTDDHGAAEVSVRVPDRLTTWRVLALAHSRTGAQGGTVTSFLGTLPTYVDPVVPKFLVAGDEVKLPIQIVNTTDKAVQSAFAVEAKNALLVSGGAAGMRQVPASGNVVEYATLRAVRPGEVTLQAALGEADVVVKKFPVLPQGRPMHVVHSGTLAAPRELALEGPAAADPATDRVRLSVVPGALALLRSELAASGSRSGVADDAYALLLAGRAPALLASLGDKPDADALRDLAILAGQRAIRDGRTLDVTSAALLAEAALAHGQNPVLARLGERAVAYLAQNQRPDGTFGGETGWTLPRLLVATADGVRAVSSATSTDADRQRALQVKTRAAAAFERNAAQVSDGYTAAAILATGALTGPAADTLRDKVKAAIKKSDDGAAYLAIEDGAQRADGMVPSTIEGTALAILALDGDASAKATLTDLGTTLLGSYGADRGWGDGRTNLMCMQAALALFKDPLPDSIKVTLTMDGKPVTEGTFGKEQLRDVVVLGGAAPGLAGKHTWKVVAEPAVVGLGYSLSLDAWVPWQKAPAHEGLELALPDTIRGTVGAAIEVPLSAVAPSNVPLHIEQSLPAGAQVDTAALDVAVTEGRISHYETPEGKLILDVPALAPGQVFAMKLRVIPTLAGTLHTGASRIEAAGHEAFLPPSLWVIR